jgi:hypothetical protein
MKIRLGRHLALVVLSAAAASVIGTAITRADVPGLAFIDINNNDALVVQPPHDKVSAQMSKQPAKLSDDLAAAIVAGAQPVDGNDVIIVYKGQLYIVPDKKIKDRMATEMVVSAGAPSRSN